MSNPLSVLSRLLKIKQPPTGMIGSDLPVGGIGGLQSDGLPNNPLFKLLGLKTPPPGMNGSDLPQNGGISGSLPQASIGTHSTGMPQIHLASQPSPELPDMSRMMSPNEMQATGVTEAVHTSLANNGSLNPRSAAPPINAPADPTRIEADPRLTADNAPGDTSVTNPLPRLLGLRPSQQTADQINALQHKDWKGADRDSDHNWWDVAKSAGLGGLQGLLQTGSLGGALGGALGGGVGGAVDRNFDEKMINNYKIGQLQNTFQNQTAMEKNAADADYRDAQTKNIYADNDRLAGIAQDNATNRVEQNQIKRQAALEKGKQATIARIYKRGYFDPGKVTPLEKAELDRYGIKPEDVGTFDFTKPNLKNVNGIAYQYNPNSKSFEPTNLPASQKDQLVDYVVSNPDGTQQSFKIPQAEAAKFKTQMSMAGSRADLQRELQQGRQQFQGEQNDLNRRGRQDIANGSLEQKNLANQIKQQHSRADIIQRGQKNFNSKDEINMALTAAGYDPIQ